MAQIEKRGKGRKPKLSLKEHLELEFQELKNQTEIEDLPKKWEKHGDLVLLPQNCFVAAVWNEIDQERLWDSVSRYFKVAKIAKKGRICDDGKRTPQVVLMKGENSWVCHIDNKIKYSYDITKSMFSAGNITEKIRMAKLKCEDETIVDMFAGIGYFTLPLLVHAKATYVHACEWNHHAVIALKKNLADNEVEDRCTLYEGDNRKVCPENVADRVIMGLIPTPIASLKAACKALKVGKGGTLHIHQNVDSKIPLVESKNADKKEISKEVTCNKNLILQEWTTWAAETADLVEMTLMDVYKERDMVVELRTEVLHIEKVKSYAPHIDHMVLDLKVSVTVQPS